MLKIQRMTNVKTLEMCWRGVERKCDVSTRGTAGVEVYNQFECNLRQMGRHAFGSVPGHETRTLRPNL